MSKKIYSSMSLIIVSTSHKRFYVLHNKLHNPFPEKLMKNSMEVEYVYDSIYCSGLNSKHYYEYTTINLFEGSQYEKLLEGQSNKKYLFA